MIETVLFGTMHSAQMSKNKQFCAGPDRFQPCCSLWFLRNGSASLHMLVACWAHLCHGMQWQVEPVLVNILCYLWLETHREGLVCYFLNSKYIGMPWLKAHTLPYYFIYIRCIQYIWLSIYYTYQVTTPDLLVEPLICHRRHSCLPAFKLA